jgi:hypothetical protein
LLNGRAHLRWTWELESSGGTLWLVPLAGRRFLTAEGPQFASLDRWLRKRLAENEKLKGIDLRTGRHRTLAIQDGAWGTETRGGWRQLDGDGWRVCLDMESLKELGYSVEAFHSAQFTFDALHTALVQMSPFGSVVTTTDTYTPPQNRVGAVDGAHLRFRKMVAREMKEVHRFGVLEPPPRSVRLVVVASRNDADTRKVLAAHLCDRATLAAHSGGEESLRSVGAADGRDTVATIWTTNRFGRGFQLPAFELGNPRLHEYDATTGYLLRGDVLNEQAEIAEREKVALIALVVLDDQLGRIEYDQLMQAFHRIKAVPIKFSSLAKRNSAIVSGVEPKWLNLTVLLAHKAGAVPWDLADLPGVTEQTVFVGIDLGHDHSRNRSKIALTLFDHRGRPLGRRVIQLGRNDERIPSEVLRCDLPRLILGRKGPPPTAVVVHRDGRYLEGESDEIIEALQDDILLLTLVAVKKDSCTRLNGAPLEGAFFELDDKRAVLVTNVQAERRSMPRPIEIERVYSNNHLSLREVVSHAFWLTRVYQGNAYTPSRLPATTRWANNVAATGCQVHLKG